jgi:DHA1 family bicyclomycin/chloramphenicol resistance-like MFS transporter
MKLSRFGLYCGLLLGINAFSIDILLPSFAAIEAGLNATLQQVQWIVPVYMFAAGLGNPFFGLWSDRAGRKPVLIAGLLLFCIGSLVCVFSASITTLLAGRFLQGFAAASAMVVCRAMIRDRFSGVALAQNMAIASMFFALGPMLAPLVGYLVYSWLGWRAVFWVLVLFGLSMLLATTLQAETLDPSKRKVGFNTVPADLLSIYRHPQSRHFIVLSCFCSGMIFTFLAYSPEIYVRYLGASEGQFSFLFALLSIGIIAGQWLNHRLIESLGAVTTAYRAAAVLFAVALCIFASIAAGMINIIVFSVLMLVFNFFYLVVVSNFLSLSMDPHASRAGSASAVFGFSSYVGGALLAMLVGFIAGADIAIWSVCFCVLALIIMLGARHWFKRLALPV